MVRAALVWLGCSGGPGAAAGCRVVGCFLGPAGVVAPRTGWLWCCLVPEGQSPGEAGGKDACGSGLKVPVESAAGGAAALHGHRDPGGRGRSQVSQGWWCRVVVPPALGQGWGWSRPARWGTALHTW